MAKKSDFDLRDFLPYLLNQAAEESSLVFQAYYRSHYGMLRTEWRTLFHLGRYGDMTAKDICERARLHKTKVSRAVAALERKRYLVRKEIESDRRHEMLSLTGTGQRVFKDLYEAAARYEAQLMSAFTEEEQITLKRCLMQIARL